MGGGRRRTRGRAGTVRKSADVRVLRFVGNLGVQGNTKHILWLLWGMGGGIVRSIAMAIGYW